MMTNSIFSLGKYMKKATVTALIFGLLISPSLALNSSFSSGSSQSLSTIVQALTEGGWLAVADTSWYDASATSFEISNAKQLAGLAKLVNEGNNFSGKTILLTNDIDLSENGLWTPIGTSMNAFEGTFNGGGHTIDNMLVAVVSNDEDVDAAGLFGVVDNAIIEGVIIGETSDIESVSSAAGICGLACGLTTIKNCTNKAEITCENGDPILCVGGIVAEICDDAKVEIINCINEGAIYARDYDEEEIIWAGGIVGYCGTGGVDETSNMTSSITNCINNGKVVSSHAGGGICAYMREGALKINNSINNGEIIASKYAGGLVALKDESGVESGDTYSESYYKENCIVKDYSKYNHAIGGIKITRYDSAILSKEEAEEKTAEIMQVIEGSIASENAVSEIEDVQNEIEDTAENAVSNIIENSNVQGELNEDGFTGWVNTGDHWAYFYKSVGLKNIWCPSHKDKNVLYYVDSEGRRNENIRYIKLTGCYYDENDNLISEIVTLDGLTYININGQLIPTVENAGDLI